MLQQFKLSETETHGPNSFSASIRNRLGSCLVDNASGASIFQLGSRQASTCLTSTQSRRMWTHRSGSATATPSLPGFQLVNDNTARFATPPACLGFCGVFASLWPSLALPSDEFGAWGKWEYRFAVTAP